MQKLKSWLNDVTLGQTKEYRNLVLWYFLDRYISSLPYAVMLGAVWFFLIPVMTPGAEIPVKQIAILTIILLVQTIIYYFISRNTYIKVSTGMGKSMKDARLLMGEKLKLLSMGFYNQRDAGDLSTILLRDFDTVENCTQSIFPQAVVIVIRLSMSLLIFTVFDWRMTLAMLLVIPVSIPFAWISYKRMGHSNDRLLKSQQSNASAILEYVSGIQTLKAFNRSGEMFHALKASCEDLRKKSIEMETAAAPVGMVARFILNCGISVVIAAGAWLLTGGSLQPFYYLVFLLIALDIYQPVLGLYFYLTNITRLNYCAGRIKEVMNEHQLPESGSRQRPSGNGIVFEHVTFAYGEKEVLKDVSFSIPRKSMTALVGPSGSGKSTITRLIARFWDASGGEVVVNGVPVTEMSQECLLEDISVVFQDVYLFHDSIEGNIRMGNPDASREQIIAAAKKAACHNFIMALPDGYQTIVGEGGSTLSGGEKQRISIARALLKDASIVLLDEATASLDPQNEVLIQQAIQELVKDKTVVVIAHRLNSIRNADQILVLNEGRVVQSGNHEQLKAQEGIYQRLWQEQQKAGSWRFVPQTGEA